jgi:hypothetical protein
LAIKEHKKSIHNSHYNSLGIWLNGKNGLLFGIYGKSEEWKQAQSQTHVVQNVRHNIKQKMNKWKYKLKP